MAQLQLQLGLLKLEEIRTALKTYFNEIRGIDYADGNNFSILLDGLSYLQEMMSYQLSQQASNNFLRTSTDRKTAVENAYKLGYVPHRKIPNKVKSSTNLSTQKIYFGQRTGLPFTVKSSDLTVAIQEETKSLFVPGTSLPNQSVTIPTKNISNSSIVVRLTAGKYPLYEQFDVFDQIPTKDSKIFFVSEVDGFTVITFGNDVIGRSPRKDETIEIQYGETFGVEGNGETKIEDLDGAVVDVVSTDEGRDSESMESIIVNGAKYHSSRGRLITKTDYTNFYKASPFSYESVDVSENSSGVNYYYAGNIYVSVVNSNLIVNKSNLVTELAKTSGFDSRKLLDWYNSGSISYVGNLSPDDSNSGITDDKKIIGTSSILSSPTFVFCDITPRIESNVSGYRYDIGNLLKIRNQLMSYSLESLRGFDVDFRTDYLSQSLFTNTAAKSATYDIDYSVIVDIDNLTDTFLINLPNDFVATNDDYYTLDNNFMGNYYEKTSQPLNRHVLYSELSPKTVSGFDFRRFLYNGAQVIDTRSFQNALVFNYDSALSVKFTNIQSFKVFNSGSSYVFRVNDSTGIVSVTTTTSNDPITRDIGTVVVDGTVPRFRLDSANTNWNDLINFSVIKTGKTSYRMEMKLEGNSVVGDSSGKQYMSIDSKVLMGRLFVDDSGKIDIAKSSMGNFTAKTDVANPKKLNFSLDDAGTIFSVTEFSGTYSLSLNGKFEVTGVNVPNIVNDELWISEAEVHGTTIGEFNRETETVEFDRILSGKNNPLFTSFIDLKVYLTGNSIMTNGTKYKIQLKPKYKIVDGNLIYQQDFNRKNGVYKLFNINTPTNMVR